MIIIASNGHFCEIGCETGYQKDAIQLRNTLTQIPQPMQSSSEIHAIFEPGLTSMQSLPRQHDICLAHGLQLWPLPLTNFDHGAAFLALLTTFLRLAPSIQLTIINIAERETLQVILVFGENGDASEGFFRLLVSFWSHARGGGAAPVCEIEQPKNSQFVNSFHEMGAASTLFALRAFISDQLMQQAAPL